LEKHFRLGGVKENTVEAYRCNTYNGAMIIRYLATAVPVSLTALKSGSTAGLEETDRVPGRTRAARGLQNKGLERK
jgi:hypothetical protein